VVLAKASRAMPAVAVAVSVPAGTAADPTGLTGVAHFLSRVIDRGTASRDAEAIADLLDGRGVSLEAAAMRHAFVLSCTCLTEDFSAMLELLGDMVRNPSLPAHEIETRRGEIVTSIRQDQDNPAMVAAEEELALLYPEGHPYGLRVKGTLDSVERIDRRPWFPDAAGSRSRWPTRRRRTSRTVSTPCRVRTRRTTHCR
jgi:zinc protease